MAAAVRHQMLPVVHLSMGPGTVTIRHRSRGGLTGTRTAGTLGRVPVEAVIAERHSTWSQFGYPVDNQALLLSTYVDNVFNIACSARHGVAMHDDFELHLWKSWGQHFKDSSRKVMPIKGGPDAQWSSGKWPRVDEINALGFVTACNGQTNSAWRAVQKSMWRAYWANCGRKASTYSVAQRLTLMNRVVEPILKYKATPWPVSKT